MKKLVSIVVAIVMVTTLLVPLTAVAEDQTVAISVTPVTETTTKVGEKLSFTVQLGTELSKDVKTAGIEIKLPETLKTTSEKKTSKWTISALDEGDPIQPSIANFDFAKLLGAATYEYNVSVQKGDIFKFEVEGVKPGKGTITLNFTFKTMDGEEIQFASGSGAIEVTVVCAEHEADTEKWYTDGTYHWRQCKNCGAAIEETKAAHTGGTATCQAKAQCEVCSAEYGKLAEHQYTVEQHDNDNHWYKCANCEATTTPEPHEGQGTYINTDNDKHWQECECGVKVNEGDHVYDNACDTTCNTCGHERTVPGHNWTNEVDDDYLKTEKKCNAYAVYYKSCSECGVSSEGITDETFEDVAGGYGDHQFDTSKWIADDTQHWHECSTCHTEKTAVDDHSFVEIILPDRSNEVVGKPNEFYKVCNVCNYFGEETFKEKTYEVTEGANAKYAGKGDISMKANVSSFQALFIDGVEVPADAFNHEFDTDGIITVNILESYLKTLAKGEHKVTILGWDGQAETTITVEESAEPTNPTNPGNATGDSANVALWLSVFVLSVVALAFTLIVSKKKSN